jgi:hypothetical protein
MLRSSSTSMPSTTSKAMARAQLLLKFPPTADQMDEWRATIQSLIGFAEAGGSHRAGPPRPPQAAATAHAAGYADGATPTVQSPPREPRDQEPDDVLMASSDPRARQGARRVLEDRRREGARVNTERHRDAHRQSDRRDGPDVDEPSLADGGYLPFEAGCPAFTSELRQVR